MPKVTAIIPCKNEAHNMKAVLESVKWADEIMVVDSFSTDETLQISRKYTDFILQREYVNSANQKNWAIPQASNEWILLVDADERVPEPLRKEIQETLATANQTHVAFWIGRQNHFLGKRIKYSGWQRDKVIRLFKRDCCRYEEKPVHAEIIANGPVGSLRNKLVHYTYKNMAHYEEKLERYAKWSAEAAFNKGVRPNIFHFWGKPAFRFFKHFIMEKGFLDGRAGWLISKLSAKTVFKRYVLLKEMWHKKSASETGDAR